MRGKEELKFTKTINNLENENPQQTAEYIRRQKIKETLMKQFNLSSDEAEVKLIEIEGKTWGKISAEPSKPEKLTLSPPENHSNVETIVPQHVIDRKNNELKQQKSNSIENNVPETSQEENIYKIERELDNLTAQYSVPEHPQEQKNIKTEEPKQPEPQKTEQEQIIDEEEELNLPQVKNDEKKGKKSKLPKLFKRNKKEEEPKHPELPEVEQTDDVDAILGDLVPNYNKDVSIELNNVNLTFEVYEDQIDNFKEQVIRTLKRNKSKSVKLHVLKDISFKIYQGEKVGIIGYNGAGKSTLLKLIVGIYKPDSGSIIANGKISPLLSLGAGFDNNFSGAKNIYLNAAILGYEREFIDKKFDEIVEFSELGESINYPIRNYSSGMKAKLGFSVATLVDPDILIIDEVLGVGDLNFKRKSRDKMRSLMGGKTTVLLVSHSINQIRELCDKAIWIDEGRVREIGEVNAVCDNYIKDSKRATKEQLKDIQFN